MGIWVVCGVQTQCIKQVITPCILHQSHQGGPRRGWHIPVAVGDAVEVVVVVGDGVAVLVPGRRMEGLLKRKRTIFAAGKAHTAPIVRTSTASTEEFTYKALSAVVWAVVEPTFTPGVLHGHIGQSLR